MERLTTSRRKFIQSSAAVTVPYFVPATSLGIGTVAPSDRIVMAAIGCGGKGRHNTKQFLKDKRVQFVACCDVDRQHLQTATQKVDKHYGTQDCQQFEDFRLLLDRDDIDAVHVSTPDHWHAVAAVRAMRQGKDVYCEKPLANSFGESKAIRDTANWTGRILQCGSHERSNSKCRLAAEIVRNGRLGQIKSVRIQMPCEQDHHLKARAVKSRPETVAPPEHLNWDLWQGPTQPREYWAGGCHFWWRFMLDYGGGEMTDRGAHIIDIAQLGLGMDDSGPISYEAKGQQTAGSPYDAFWDYEFTNTYANGVQLIGTTQGPRGLKFEGSDGWLFVAIHGGALQASDPSLLQTSPETFKVKLGRSPGHHQNFIDSVLSRQPTMATAEIGHRTATICHLNNIAMRTGRKIIWDPDREALLNDPEAGEQLIPQMRIPWTV